MEIIYSDKRILVCIKPVGIVSVDEPGGLPDAVRAHLGDPQACVRPVNRLDQPVGGIMVLARSREAARRLSLQVQGRTFDKEYLAVVHGVPTQREGEMCDLLTRSKTERRSYVTDTPGKDVQQARLCYRLLEVSGGLSLVKIALDTGRTHQIRTQFSSRGMPLVGDRKYGAPAQDMSGIALWSNTIGFIHPQTDEQLRFSAPPPKAWPWTEFECLEETVL